MKIIKYGNINNYQGEIYQFKPILNNKNVNLDKISDPIRLKQKLLGHYFLLLLLNKKGINYSDVTFQYNKYGKPYLNNYKLFFNISHDKDMVVCIISNKLCGIDIKKVEKINFLTIKYFTNNKELNYILKNKNQINTNATKIFCLKEAYFKMLGTNILNPKKVEFLINNNSIDCSDKTVKCYITELKNNYIVAICEKKIPN